MKPLTFPKLLLALIVCFCVAPVLSAQGFTARWLARVSATQAAQPHWMTPVATVTPRLEQEFRFDTVHEQKSAGNLTSLGGGKGLELIPSRNTELLINLPPYLLHQNPKLLDGWGDVSFLMKYRLLSRNEQHGAAILTVFLGGGIPTGTHQNGSISAIVTPTLAAGKGWGKFDVQATLGGNFPVDSLRQLGRTVLSNSAFQYHLLKQVWPEVEINSSFWLGGANDGKKQTFLTPGLVLGRFLLHHRIAIVAGAGFQIATTHYSQYNHAFIGSLRMPF